MYSTINLEFLEAAHDLRGAALLREAQGKYSIGKHKPRKTPGVRPTSPAQDRVAIKLCNVGNNVPETAT